MALANTLPGTLRRVIPQWLSQLVQLTFSTCRGRRIQIVSKIDLSQQMVTSHSRLSISKEIPSRPGAFPDLSTVWP